MDEFGQIDVPERSADLLAAITTERWNYSVFWRDNEKIGDKSVGTVLRECYEQRAGILAPCDRKIVDELGVDNYINLSGLKVSALVAWLRDLLVESIDLPFNIEPAPISELSDRAQQAVLLQVKKQLFSQGGFNGDLLQTIQQLKYQQTQTENQYAQTAVDNMMTLIKNQCLEGGFYNALLKTINDLSTYPYAVLHGPIPTMVETMEWNGNTLKAVQKMQLQFRPVSVFDFFWTPDSPDAQRGTGVFIREKMNKHQLYGCAKLKSYISQNVISVIEEVTTGRLNLSWLSKNPEQPDKIGSRWGNGATVDILRHYGLFSGRELEKCGMTGLDDHQYYETCVSICGGYTIQAYVVPVPNPNSRPIYTASFETSADRIPGTSICQKLRDTERAYLFATRCMMVNGSFSAGPITEADYSRLHKWMKPEDVGRLASLMMYMAEPDLTGGGRPAMTFHEVPSNIGAYINMAQYFMDLADRITQIPASLHGEPVGTGANRTFRGMAMLYGNAIKPIQSALANLDNTMFQPLAQLMYNYNMKYSDDDSVKADARVIAQGAKGLIDKEVAKQNAMDTLQFIAQAGSAAPGLIEPSVFKWAINSALRAAGVPVDELDTSSQQTIPAGVNPMAVGQAPLAAQPNPSGGLPQTQPLLNQ